MVAAFAPARRHTWSPLLPGLALLWLLLPLPGAAGSEVYFSPNGGIRQRLLETIGEARLSIDIAMYNLTAVDLAEALSAAKARGVQVRFLADRENAGAGGLAFRILGRRRVPLRVLGVPEQSLMHHKFAVFDGRLAVTGSYNWTHSAELANYENLVILDDPEIVGRFQREFARLWQQAEP